ncbi:SLATT domain-containing protein [Stutzerimonas nitrititolerans]|uniref:SLATT domain-containing protein n=1 Tax=Stutzerimonas nitrititolerans TaxID=2482751 RepID=UPI0028ACEEE0|nr:SLATT domain-containing protein [Stutzerimonas nitrititolerans]
METYLKKLATQAWQTAGARYNAARRLRQRELFSTISLAMFSALSIAIASLQLVYSDELSKCMIQYLTAFSISLGLLILTFTLMEWGSSNSTRAAELHSNAENINSFQSKIWLSISQLKDGFPHTWAEIETLRSEYEDIKQSCSANHSPLDHKLFVSNHRKAPEFSSKAPHGWRHLLTKFSWYFSSVWYYIISWFAIAAAILSAPIISGTCS